MTQCLLLPYMPAFFVMSGHKMTALMTVFRDFQTSDLSKPDHIDEKIALSLFVISLKSIGLVILLRIAFTVVQLLFPGPGLFPRSGELRTRKLKSHLVRTQSLNVLPLKPAVGQYIAIHATLTARDFVLANFYPSGPFTCIFSKTSPEFFLC